MARLVVLMTLVLLLGGCFGGGSEQTGQEEATKTSEPPPGPEDDGPAMHEAPELGVGDWWRWEVSGRDHPTFEVTTVVAHVEESSWSIGVLDARESLPMHILHVPPVGEVGRDGFRWSAHGHPVDLIEFPLFDGKVYNGSIEDRPVRFETTALERDGRTVYEIDGIFQEFEGQGPRFVYDPEVGMLDELHLHYGGQVPFSSARVVDHGSGRTGAVTIPHAEDKYLESVGMSSPQDAVDAFDAGETKVWLVFACFLGGTTGLYEIHFVTPSPNEDPLSCSYRNEGTEFAGDMQVFWRASVPGEWTVAFSVIGSGFAEAEVIGVRQETCTLVEDDDGQVACG